MSQMSASKLNASSRAPFRMRKQATISFITISRQLGAGDLDLPERLAEALNQQLPSGEHRWTTWDREVIEKAAADHDLPLETVPPLEDSGYSFMDTFFSGLGGTPEEFGVLHSVEESVDSLVQAGRAILVGHGAAFMTREMPGGLHVRLVAPWLDRVERIAEQLNIHTDQAVKHLHEAESKCDAFLQRYWPANTVEPEAFAATLNTGILDPDRVVHSIVALLH